MELKTTKMLANIEDGIGWVTFNQPEKRNAISLSMWTALGTILDTFNQDPEVRVIVMKGAGGKAFVSGADISEFEAQRSNALQRAEYGKVAAAANQGLAQIDKPLIAMIQGYCIGGGLATALNADVRFATPDSTFGIPAARLGLGYEMSGLRALVGLVGPSNASDIMISARYFKATEALQMGLINFVVGPEQIESEVVEYAKKIAGNAPMTIRAARHALREIQKPDRLQSTEKIQKLIDDCFNSKDYQEGRAAFREKRLPHFVGE